MRLSVRVVEHNYMHIAVLMCVCVSFSVYHCVCVCVCLCVRVLLPYFRLMMASTRIRQMKKSTSTCVVVYSNCGVSVANVANVVSVVSAASAATHRSVVHWGGKEEVLCVLKVPRLRFLAAFPLTNLPQQ